MKERPIICRDWQVRAILDGRKTQTRRPVKFEWCGTSDALLRQSQFDPAYKSPFGTVGDRLWVKETWGLMAHHDPTDWFRVGICGLDEDSLAPLYATEHRANWRYENENAFWRSPVSMPRWASRIDLEITAVRVERVQDITEEDAKAEGIMESEAGRAAGKALATYKREVWPPLVLQFADLWQSIYGTWDANPWVWVYEFRRVKP